MASEERIKKINELMKRELSRIILREIEFPRGILATITEVRASQDLSDGKILISVFPEKEMVNALKILAANAAHLQYLLIRALKIHPVPRIRFVADKELVGANKVEEILARIETKE